MGVLLGRTLIGLLTVLTEGGDQLVAALVQNLVFLLALVALGMLVERRTRGEQERGHSRRA